jgi:nucleotidyltransferase/DNA polymerase involved in DNA repair
VSLRSYPIPALSLRWLYVDFNSYFASVEQQLRPELRGKPIAVVAVETDSTSAIAASYEAKAFGIKTGTKIHEANAYALVWSASWLATSVTSNFITV